jgi:MFS family permease
MDQSESPEKIYISELSQVDTKDSEVAREDDRIIARRLLWKIDLRILPILTILYIFAAMDRSDLGNAQVAGMQADLGATSKQWTLVAALFYVGYIVAQPVGALYLRRISPPIIFSFACCVWGVSVHYSLSSLFACSRLHILSLIKTACPTLSLIYALCRLFRF